MDFKLSDEEKLIRDTAAQFVNRELLTREGAYLKQKEPFLPPGDPPRRELDPALRATLTSMAQRIGLWAPELPTSEDAAPVSAVARVLIHREFGRTILPFAPASIPPLMRMSDRAQDLAAGKASLALAFGQLHRSGNLTGITTRFRQSKEDYALSNTDVDVTEHDAHLILFPALEEGSTRAGLFLLEPNSAGVSIGGATDLTTDGTVARLTLRDCKVRPERLLGYEYEVQEIVASEQLRIAARSLGIANRCLGSAIEHARNRVTFGRPLAERQGIQWMLADISVELRTCTWLTFEAAWRADQGEPYFEHAALAKKRAAKMAFSAADGAVQIHGGYGVCKEFPFEGFYREARLMRLLYGQEGELDRAAGMKFLSTE